MEIKKNNHSITEIQEGDKLTWIGLNCLTQVVEVEVVIKKGKRFLCDSTTKGGHYLPTDQGTIILKGHNLNILPESEIKKDEYTLWGSPLIRIGGMPFEELRTYIEENNLNENFNFWRFLVYSSTDQEDEKPFYPEMYTENIKGHTFTIQRVNTSAGYKEGQLTKDFCTDHIDGVASLSDCLSFLSQRHILSFEISVIHSIWEVSESDYDLIMDNFGVPLNFIPTIDSIPYNLNFKSFNYDIITDGKRTFAFASNGRYCIDYCHPHKQDVENALNQFHNQ